jgi:hypothetical protein
MTWQSVTHTCVPPLNPSPSRDYVRNEYRCYGQGKLERYAEMCGKRLPQTDDQVEA